MKKTISILLTAAMLISCGVQSFAEDTEITEPQLQLTQETEITPIEFESYTAMRSSLSLKFTKDINKENLDLLSLADADGTEFDFTAEPDASDNSKLNITFAEPLELGKEYTLSAPFIADAANESVIADFSVTITSEEIYSDDFESYDNNESFYEKYFYRRADGRTYPMIAALDPEAVTIELFNGSNRLKLGKKAAVSDSNDIFLMPRVDSEQVFQDYILEYTVANAMSGAYSCIAYQGVNAYGSYSLTIDKRYTPNTNNYWIYLEYPSYANPTMFSQIKTDDDIRFAYVMNGPRTAGHLSVYQNGECKLDNFDVKYNADYGVFGFKYISGSPVYIDDIFAYKINCDVVGSPAALEPISPVLSAENFTNGSNVLCDLGDYIQPVGVNLCYNWYTSKDENQYPQSDDEWELSAEDGLGVYTITNENKYLKCIVRQEVGGITLNEYAAPVLFKPVPPLINVKDGKPVADVTKKDDNTLSVSYEYMDANSDREDGTTIEWYTSTDLSASKKWELKKTAYISEGSETNDFDFDVSGIIDTFVKCVITVRSEHESDEPIPTEEPEENPSPVSDEDIYTGEPVTLNYTLPFRPVVSDVKITGTAEEGKVIKATYTYYDENGDAENTDKTNIVWYRVKGSAQSKIGTGVTYAVSSSDAGFSIKCEVTPYTDTLPNEGETVSSASVSVTKRTTSNSTSSTGGSSSGISVNKNRESQMALIGNPYMNSSTFVSMPEEKELSFTDTKGHWACNDIESLYEKGLVNGRDNGKFEPDAPITRAEWLSLLIRGAQIDTSDVKWDNCFFDVDKNEWYALDIQAAFDLGLVSGGDDGSFAPDEYITREAMAKMLVDVYEYIINDEMDASSARSFADDDTISSWADVYVKKASASGLINGDDRNCFNPKNKTTRAEASAVLSRMLEMTEED